MIDERRCRLRYHGDDLDLAGRSEALRALADVLRGVSGQVPLANGTLVQTVDDGALAVALEPGPVLRLRGSAAALEPFWAALESTAAQAETATERTGPEPHAHVGSLVVTAQWPVDPLAGL